MNGDQGKHHMNMEVIYKENIEVMKEANDRIVEIYEYQKRLGYLQEINLYRKDNAEGGAEFILDITLSEYPFQEYNQKLVLKFTGVRNFTLCNVDNLYKIMICITDIRTYQMEDINYRIKEEENDIFSFECKKIFYEIN